MTLINCKIHLELNWAEDCVLSSTRDSEKCKITDAKLHVPIVTLSTKNNVNLAKQLSNRFKGSVYWNNYQIIPAIVIANNTNIHVHHFKVLKDHLFFPIMQQVIIMMKQI